MRALEDFDQILSGDLSRRQRLLLKFAVGIGAVLLFFTVLYYLGMRHLEDRPRTLFHSFQEVVSTMTTTGYGADAAWSTPAMNLLVITMMGTGVVIGFVTLRVLVIPLFERTPLHLDDRLTTKHDHVVVAEYERDTGELLDELEELDVDYVLVESDEEEAKQLSDDGYQAINGDAETARDLRRASIGEASLLITDAGDRTASVVLTALEENEVLRVVAFTESTRRKAALAEVGVDRSVAPHALIGQRLAEKATTPLAVADEGGDETAVDVREILVRRGSPLHGVTVAESPLSTHPDLTLVAGWFDGELHVPPAPEIRLTPNTVLVVAGPADELDELATEVAGVRSPLESAHSRVVVAGLGEGGTAALEALPTDATVTTIDQDAAAEPDVVGDATEPGVLQEAGIDEATALVVTMDDDATALLTIAMARSLAPQVEILARVTDAEKSGPAFRAGADYVLSIQRVCARLVAGEAHGERVVEFASQLRIVRIEGEPLAGETVGDLRAVPGRGWTVVGVIREGTLLTDESLTVGTDDEVFVAGDDEAIAEFERTVDSE